MLTIRWLASKERESQLLDANKVPYSLPKEDVAAAALQTAALVGVVTVAVAALVAMYLDVTVPPVVAVAALVVLDQHLTVAVEVVVEGVVESVAEIVEEDAVEDEVEGDNVGMWKVVRQLFNNCHEVRVHYTGLNTIYWRFLSTNASKKGTLPGF